MKDYCDSCKERPCHYSVLDCSCWCHRRDFRSGRVALPSLKNSVRQTFTSPNGSSFTARFEKTLEHVQAETADYLNRKIAAEWQLSTGVPALTDEDVELLGKNNGGVE